LSGNELSGQMPSFWTSFANPKHFSLADNQFSCEIPPELGFTCQTLVELDLLVNQLSGELPTTL